MNILRACLDRRVLAVLAAVGVGIFLLAPNVVAAAAPLLLVAACPISMVVMMRTMGGQHGVSEPTSGTATSTERIAQLRGQIAASRREEARLAHELERLETVGRLLPSQARAAKD